MSTETVKKREKQIVWGILRPTGSFGARGTRQDAREDRRPRIDKIIRIEIVDGKINAKFVR